MFRHTLVASLVGLVLVLGASVSQAQTLPPGAVITPGGGVILPGGPFGNTTVITADRFNNPLANQAIPGTQSSAANYVPGVGWVTSSTYIGWDGRPHGTTVIPNGVGGNTTVYQYQMITNSTAYQSKGAQPKDAPGPVPMGGPTVRPIR